jgi:site-specific DNA-adenine methylase
MVQLFGRLGNKTTDIKHFKQYLPTDNKMVIEPFGGSFAVIRKEYADDKYKKYVNDNDQILYKIYTNFDKYSKLSKDFNDIATNTKNEDLIGIPLKSMLPEIEEYAKKNKIDNDLINFWKSEKTIKGIVKVIKNADHTEFINIMKNISFSCDDWETVINKFKHNKDAFIFLDPPYLYSDNSGYSKCKFTGGMDVSDIIYKVLEIFKDKKTKSKIMFIINDIKLIRWLFNDFIKGEYTKIYQVSKRKENHLIICNF